jgi:hypothetical protein
LESLEQYAAVLRSMKDVSLAESIEERAKYLRVERTFTVPAQRLTR